jgi:formylglycine-generating enzyme required for sulfatase activity
LNKKHKNDLPESYIFRLPTEFEWEKAARGVDGREWPWGNEFDETRCNTLESKKGGTSPVGSYSPQGDSPFGVADMAGNVLEWTQSLYLPYRILKPKKIQKSKTYVLRGGSYFQGSKSARCATRYDKGISSYKWIGGYGFRVVIAPSDYF